jgi:hypothetical protein
MTRLLAALCLSAVLCGTALAGGGRNVNLPATFKPQLAKLKKSTRVPVLLPPSIRLLGNYKVYGSGFGARNQYNLELSGAPDCHGANACFVAMFAGQRGGTLPYRQNTTLANGDPAAFKPVTCGGSCSPNSFWFIHKGYLYSWQAKDIAAPRAALTRMANQALAAGPR